jgi:uncharacterized protein YbaR (Trm112 family)
MHLDIVDVLRCPADHEQMPVVAVPHRVDGREMISGTIGCPRCGAEYPVADGVLDMRSTGVAEVSGGGGARASIDDADFPLRLAAMMDLTYGRAFGVIVGGWGAHAPALRSLTPTPLVLVDPPDPLASSHWEKVSVILAESLPFLDATVPAIALSPGVASGRLREVAAAAAPRARIVTLPSSTLPAGLTELARDESFVVSERQPQPLVLALGRRASTGPADSGG